MELNAESVLDALNDFERKPLEIPPILEEYLQRIAQNGEIIFPWCKLKPLLKRKLELVLDEFYETCPVEISVPVPNFETFNFDTLKKTILQAVDSFTSAPFTIQRLCELVTNPKKHYNRTDKYMRGIEKNVLVVSTIEPRTGNQGDGNNGNVNPVVNGMINDSPRDDNDCFNGHENENTDDVTSSNLNTPSNHVLLENFANVFPSAACIPSASNICINRDIDSNFMSDSECVETQEVEFSAAIPAEESTESKDEEMDTISEEQQDFPVANCEVTSGDGQVSENPDLPDEQSAKAEEPTLSLSPNSGESVSASEDNKHEADCSESSIESSICKESATVTTTDCQQDDTVSQSDNSHNATEISQSDDAIDDKSSPNLKTSKDVAEEVSQSLTSESSEQCMELESSTSSDEPQV